MLEPIVFQVIILLTQLALVGGLLAFIGAGLARGISAYLDVPFLGTKPQILPKIEKLLLIGPNDVVYDLGCGDGRFLFLCARRHPDARFIGVERNPVLHTYSKILWFLHGRPKNVMVKQGDIFKTDFSDATRIFVFLLPSVMNELFAGNFSHAKDLRLVSRAFTISGKHPVETVRLSEKDGWFGEHLAYVYEFGAAA